MHPNVQYTPVRKCAQQLFTVLGISSLVYIDGFEKEQCCDSSPGYGHRIVFQTFYDQENIPSIYVHERRTDFRGICPK